MADRNGIIGYASIVILGALLAVFVRQKANMDLDVALDHYKAVAHDDAELSTRKVESSFAHIYQNIRTISFLPSVKKIDRYGSNIDSDARLSIQQIYNNLAGDVSVSEVYIVPVDLEPDQIDPVTHKLQEPILMFDELITAHPETSTAQNYTSEIVRDEIKPLEEVEIYEYRQLREQLSWLKRHYPKVSDFDGLKAPYVSGPEVITCDNTKYSKTLNDADRSGIILSVPFYSEEGALKGSISAIIRTDAIRAFIPGHNYAITNLNYNYIVTPNEAGQENLSRDWVDQAKADPSLLFSETLPVSINDPRSQWSGWVGRPNSEFLNSDNVRAILDFKYIGLGGAAFITVLCAALWATMLRRRAAEQVAIVRDLADAAVEGLVVCDGDLIVTANASFEALVGVGRSALAGQNIDAIVEKTEAGGHFDLANDNRLETELKAASGELIPVEMISRRMSYTGRPHRVFAVRDLRERRKADEHIRFLAHNDSLTGLPNRASFDRRLGEELAQHRRAQTQFAVVCLDLDRFKEINDVFGHATGDAVLQALAQRVSAVIGKDDMFARLGGDEFILISADEAQPSAAASLIDAIRAALAEELAIGAHRFRIGVSMGVAIYPIDGADATMLMGNADAALYRAKGEGRGDTRFFEAEMDRRLRERHALQHDLRSALALGELAVHYQPQGRINGEIFGFEALIRWRNRGRGLVPPATFIPIAEESGLIMPIGEWVLREACREAASWPKPLQISVNLSPIQFRHGDLPELVHSILFETGLAPARLELEVTEGVLISDPPRALAILRRLKALGVKIAMDDFGTGYSSLSSLQSFPFDKIKIDRGFISNLGHNGQSVAIVRAVLGLGRGLNIRVIAEGVETEEQRAFLVAEDCMEIQGYLIGRPLPIGDYAELVNRPVRVDHEAKLTV